MPISFRWLDALDAFACLHSAAAASARAEHAAIASNTAATLVAAPVDVPKAVGVAELRRIAWGVARDRAGDGRGGGRGASPSQSSAAAAAAGSENHPERCYPAGSLRVRLLRAEGLALSSAKGLYAWLQLGPDERRQSHAAGPTLLPQWHETFEFRGESLSALKARPLQLKLYDLRRGFRAGYYVGRAHADLRPQRTLRSREPLNLVLPLSSGGIVEVELRWCPEPLQWRHLHRNVGPLLADRWFGVTRRLFRLRALLLYSYLPYDKTIYGKLVDPACLSLLVFASLPFYYGAVRALFFSVLLACFLVDTELSEKAREDQLMTFILNLKGTQFFSGFALLGLGYGQFHYCALRALPICDVAGPGSGWLVPEQARSCPRHLPSVDRRTDDSPPRINHRHVVPRTPVDVRHHVPLPLRTECLCRGRWRCFCTRSCSCGARSCCCAAPPPPPSRASARRPRGAPRRPRGDPPRRASRAPPRRARGRR